MRPEGVGHPFMELAELIAAGANYKSLTADPDIPVDPVSRLDDLAYLQRKETL